MGLRQATKFWERKRLFGSICGYHAEAASPQRIKGGGDMVSSLRFCDFEINAKRSRVELPLVRRCRDDESGRFRMNDTGHRIWVNRTSPRSKRQRKPPSAPQTRFCDATDFRLLRCLCRSEYRH